MGEFPELPITFKSRLRLWWQGYAALGQILLPPACVIYRAKHDMMGQGDAAIIGIYAIMAVALPLLFLLWRSDPAIIKRAQKYVKRAAFDASCLNAQMSRTDRVVLMNYADISSATLVRRSTMGRGKVTWTELCLHASNGDSVYFSNASYDLAEVARVVLRYALRSRTQRLAERIEKGEKLVFGEDLSEPYTLGLERKVSSDSEAIELDREGIAFRPAAISDIFGSSSAPSERVKLPWQDIVRIEGSFDSVTLTGHDEAPWTLPYSVRDYLSVLALVVRSIPPSAKVFPEMRGFFSRLDDGDSGTHN